MKKLVSVPDLCVLSSKAYSVFLNNKADKKGGNTEQNRSQALKAAALVEDGVEAKLVIKDGEVTVNGEVDTRRGRKLYDGDVVCYNGNEIQIKK